MAAYRHSIILAICLSVVACKNSSETSDEKNVFVERAKANLIVDFNDPSSAQFRDERYYNTSFGEVYCGEVNGKNSFGAYVGFRRFIVTEERNGLSSVFPDDRGMMLSMSEKQGRASSGICQKFE